MVRTCVLIMTVMVFLSGCVTASPNAGNANLSQMRVGELEQEVRLKDDEIKDLQYQVKDLNYEIDRLKSKMGRSDSLAMPDRRGSDSSGALADGEIIRIDVSARQVQIALQNAGYYKGKIDGKVGEMTKSAISSFQKDHGLKIDGLLGQKTWNELKKYLDR
ncbi:MAG TPA: peptidoglycan-binding domain-containing protein [Candidatus Omnitrophota bacterium]|nr:peptidoglycan-binding domain-containing protein [Candidatus Omnitrophota bacterium]HPN55697.1 peptidoglycan-binding domain-containing protein [Candidatus Omnitrophota bacterium]